MKSACVKTVLVIFLLDLLAFESLTSRQAEDDYYVDKNYMQQYGNDFIFCGNVAIAACSLGSIGCRLRFSTDVTRKFLHQTFTCINEDRTDGLKISRRTELPRARTITIDLDIYIDTESSYNVGYRLGGDEFANGVIALDKWDEMRDTLRREKKRIDVANA